MVLDAQNDLDKEKRKLQVNLFLGCFPASTGQATEKGQPTRAKPNPAPKTVRCVILSRS